MILTNVRIAHFKCIRDSGEFAIDPDVTSLVGKNESGKTAILEALEKLNPLEDADAEFDDLDYPRSHLSDFRDREEGERVDVLTTKWLLEPDDVAAVEKVFGTGVLKSNAFEISKGYEPSTLWNLQYDETKGLKNLVDGAGLHEEEKRALHNLTTVKAVIEFLNVKKPAGDTDIENARSPREEAFREQLNNIFRKNRKTCWQGIIDILDARLPKMVYFSEYLRMPGQVSLQDLKTRPGAKDESGNKVFAALLAMIGRTMLDLEDIGEFERLQAELEGASNRLTREIFRYWTQNKHLRVQCRFEQGLPKDPPPFDAGFVMRTRIENTRHGVTTSFDERSAGFVWFFSFLVWFSQVRRTYGGKLILLLDEPGLSLHAKAQADLLRYFDERLNDYQVIYTTHSPFMVDTARITRARTVEDIFIGSSDPAVPDQDVGTKVGSDVLSTDRDTLFPLQAALGYDITQSLFVGEHTLLVEGPSELLYVPWFSRKLASLNRTSLDKRWVLTPCGGIDKVTSFLSLFAGQKLHIATFVDFGEGSKKRVRDLRESELLRTGHVLSADTYAGASEADIEDMIGREGYAALVNACFNLTGKTAFHATKQKNESIRVVKAVEDHFRTTATSGPEFDHFRPAEYLTQQGLDLSLPGLDDALGRFEKLFGDLNSLLA